MSRMIVSRSRVYALDWITTATTSRNVRQTRAGPRSIYQYGTGPVEKKKNKIDFFNILVQEYYFGNTPYRHCEVSKLKTYSFTRSILGELPYILLLFILYVLSRISLDYNIVYLLPYYVVFWWKKNSVIQTYPYKSLRNKRREKYIITK
jgi:hypothetical protein